MNVPVLHARARLAVVWALVAWGALPAVAQVRDAQGAGSTVSSQSQTTRHAQLLVAHPVLVALTQMLVQGTGMSVLRPVPDSLPASRHMAYFAGRGAAPLAQAARQADAVVGLRSIWPDDPLFVLARRQNIRLIEIDAARPLDASLPGVALQDKAAAASDLPWLDPVNLGRMAEVVAADLARMEPAAKPQLQANVATLRQQLVALAARTHAELAQAPNLAVYSLSDRLAYLVSGFNLDLVGVDARADEDWSAPAIAQLVEQLRRASVVAVLSHRELPAALGQALQQAGVNTVVLRTEGLDPLAELQVNSQRLAALAQL